MRTMLAFVLAVLFLFAGCSQPSQTLKTSSRQKSAIVDEYAVLDDQTTAKPLTDQVLNRKLEEVRKHYLMALRASHQNNDAVASQHFEAAISTLNDLVTYPNIYAHPEFEKLSESVIHDYEAQITSIDSLDPNSSFFVLRDKIFQEIESIPVERRQYPKAEIAAGATEEIELQIPLPDNEPVQQCIAFFTSERGRKFFSAWLARTGRYFPMYERVLEEEEVPLELKHLSMIESGLKPTAVSWAKAVGLWQFIPSTGQQYGMDINWYVDERRDPEIATHAAARFLRDLYQDLGDWHLALASYNCGPGRVKAAIAKANSRDYWTIRRYLPRETQQYVPLYIAATKITLNPEQYGFTEISYERPDLFDTITVKTDYDLPTIAQVAGTTVERLKELNPALLRDQLPQSATHYTIRVPMGTPIDFAMQLEQIPVPEKPQIKWLTHKVARGESATSIAKRYNIPVTDVYAANKMTPKSRLRRGTALRIPIKTEPTDRDDQKIAAATKSTSTEPTATTDAPLLAQAEPAPHPTPTEAVETESDEMGRDGEVADAATTAPAQEPLLASADRAPQSAPSMIRRTVPDPVAGIEKKPTVAARSEKPTEATKLVEKKSVKISYHTVKRGETLAGIAKKHGVSTSNLTSWNKLGRKATLQAGKKLAIHKTVTTRTAVAVADQPTIEKNSRKRAVTTTSSRYETHKVRNGESLIVIADRYGVSVDDLKTWNPKNANGNTLMAGAKLKIYSETPSKGDARKSSRASKTTAKTYKVRKGDTMAEIANKFGVSVAELRRNNPKISERSMRVGQTVRIKK